MPYELDEVWLQLRNEIWRLHEALRRHPPFGEEEEGIYEEWRAIVESELCGAWWRLQGGPERELEKKKELVAEISRLVNHANNERLRSNDLLVR
jgi:hypothetical protein